LFKEQIKIKCYQNLNIVISIAFLFKHPPHPVSLIISLDFWMLGSQLFTY